MDLQNTPFNLEEIKQAYPQKFAPEGRIFKYIHRGDTLFVGTGCGVPQYLLRALAAYMESHPTAFFDAEVFQVWTLGIGPDIAKKFKSNFRLNTLFAGDDARETINQGLGDYTPAFLSQVPRLFKRKLLPLDVALIQTSLPDQHGYVSLGISVDLTKAAVDTAKLVIAQINTHMPRVPGDGFIHLNDIDFIIPYDEPLLEYSVGSDDQVIQRIGAYVSYLIQDGDTIQVGYGSTPNAILPHLTEDQHLGVHTEFLTDGIVALMKRGVVDNSRKNINPGRTIASFCMGTAETYSYINNNPKIEFRTIDYTNNPLIIAQHDNMVAINSALEIDLTGQATAESLGKTLYRGVGGQVDFMKGAAMARNGKSILALPSTAENSQVSRIVPFLKEGAGVTFGRGDVHYVVTEYGIAYLHGKSIRERAMELITIAHPDFKPWLIQEAKKLNIIYQDQAFIPGKRGEYPEHLETYKTTKTGLEIMLRPVKISDEPLLKDFFYNLSDKSLYRRFISMRKDMPHERLQEFVVIDYTQDMIILVVLKEGAKEEVIGMGEYNLDPVTHTAEVSFAVRDDYQGQGIGSQLLDYLTLLAKKQGLLGFTATVLFENNAMLHLFQKMDDVDLEKRFDGQTYELRMFFR